MRTQQQRQQPQRAPQPGAEAQDGRNHATPTSAATATSSSHPHLLLSHPPPSIVFPMPQICYEHPLRDALLLILTRRLMLTPNRLLNLHHTIARTHSGMTLMAIQCIRSNSTPIRPTSTPVLFHHHTLLLPLLHLPPHPQLPLLLLPLPLLQLLHSLLLHPHVTMRMRWRSVLFVPIHSMI